MPEAKYVVQGERAILLMDFAHIVDYGTLPPLVDESIRLAQSSNAPRSVLALIDLSGTRVTGQVIDSLKRLSKNNGPFIKAIAFVGLSAVWYFLVSVLLQTSGRRNHRVMRNRSEAIRWLTLQ